MADLRGGSTVGGRPILGKEARDNYLGMIVGNKMKESMMYQQGTILKVSGDIELASGKSIMSAYNSNIMLADHSNGNVTLSATGGQLYLGYLNTTSVRLQQNLVGSNGSTIIADTTGKLFYQGTDVNNKYLGASSNAVSASKWATARTITLSGDLSGSVTFDGSANVTLTGIVVDSSHNHIISNIDGLQNALDGKLNMSGGTLSGSLNVSSDLYVAGNINFNNGLLMSHYGDANNIDHVWHDDTSNEWHFVSDGTAKQVGNSKIVAGKAIFNVGSYIHVEARQGTDGFITEGAGSVDYGQLVVRAGNQSMQIGMDNVQNTRQGYIQVGHNSTSYAGYYGTLHLQPLGGDVSFGTGVTKVKGNLELLRTATLKNSSWLIFESSSSSQDKIIEFKDASGVREGYYGRINSNSTPYFSITNTKSGKVLALYDNSEMYYSAHARFAGAVTAPSWNTSSLREFKRDIIPFEQNALERIMSTPIREFSFNWDEEGMKRRVGVIVDESPEEILSDDKRGVDTYNMVSISWKAIQELKLEIENLKSQLAEKG